MQLLTQERSHASNSLLARLRDRAQRDSASAIPCLQIRGRNTYQLSSVRIDSPAIAILLQGRKAVRTSTHHVDMLPGDLLVIPNPCTMDVWNIPDETSCYLSVALPLDAEVIAVARQLLRDPVSNDRGGVAAVDVETCVDDITAWLDAAEANNEPRAYHALVGTVLNLYAQGQLGLMYAAPPTLSSRIRTMVAGSPAREWSSADIESHLALSGASLRRRLAAEGLSLREIVADARLSHALTLLTTTGLSVKVVAQRVGYASVSAFSRRFAERYGVDPSRVGNT